MMNTMNWIWIEFLRYLVVIYYWIFMQIYIVKNIIKKVEFQQKIALPVKYYRKHYTLLLLFCVILRV